MSRIYTKRQILCNSSTQSGKRCSKAGIYSDGCCEIHSKALKLETLRANVIIEREKRKLQKLKSRLREKLKSVDTDIEVGAYLQRHYPKRYEVLAKRLMPIYREHR
jgi:hypothetical protein